MFGEDKEFLQKSPFIAMLVHQGFTVGTPNLARPELTLPLQNRLLRMAMKYKWKIQNGFRQFSENLLWYIETS